MTITSTSIVSHVGIRFAGWVIACALRSHVMYRKSASGCERVHCSSNRCCHQKAGPVASLGWIWRSSLVAHESKSMAHRNKPRCDPASVDILRPTASTHSVVRLPQTSCAQRVGFSAQTKRKFAHFDFLRIAQLHLDGN
jgi:hypothetical protein